jgi:predicted O-linked N-acetylglucosamine transferase (SPINDLY family)
LQKDEGQVPDETTEPQSSDPTELERQAAECRRQGRLLEALKLYDRVIELGAASAATWYATGDALAEVAEYAQAIGAYEQALRLRPNDPKALHDLARVLYRLGDVERAARHLEQAAALCDSINPWLSLATLVPGAPGASQERICEVRMGFARRLRDAYGPGAQSRPLPALPRAGGRLRVGFLSAHFHLPHYMKPVWALINQLDRQAFEVRLFSDSPQGAPMPGYAGHRRDQVVEVAGLRNDETADAIRYAGVHLLVDLGAFSSPERLPLVFERPAPLTAAWFNLYATSGLPGLDYLIGDEMVLRDGEDRFYTERLLRLPMSYLTFAVAYSVPPVAPPPCLANGHLTFGSLVSQYKATPQVLDAWAEILRRAPDSRLLLANAALKSVHNRQYVADRFAERGIAAERLLLEGPALHLEFLQKYDRIDLALDAFPYNGGTTTTEAIWQGVPVLTFAGDRWASRTSQSLLQQTHLAEFVAGSTREYIEQAVALAQDPGTPTRLAALRTGMREGLSRSPSCNVSQFARSMERLFRQMVSEAVSGGHGQWVPA